MNRLWCVLIIALIASQSANVAPATPAARGLGGLETGDPPKGGSEPNDPNEILWKKWDVLIKDPNDPNEMLWKKWCAVTKVLQTKTIAQETKERIIDKIVTPIFDFPLMAKLVLGRNHWSQFTEPQREKFTTLFTNRLKTSYREKISLYTDETASLKPAQRTNTTVSIPMELASGDDKKTAILYKLRKVGKTWKIYDVEIEGVSILLTYRSQFDDILRTGSAEDLLRRLEEPPTP